MIRFCYLVDRPDLLPVLARWFVAEWEPYYGQAGPGDAESDLHSSMNRDALPICIIAVNENDAPLGTISLKRESISHPELSPWGAAFVVAPGHRNAGVGTALVAELEREARRLNFDNIYMSTDAATKIVECRGWNAIDTTESLRGTITVYGLGLRPTE